MLKKVMGVRRLRHEVSAVSVCPGKWSRKAGAGRWTSLTHVFRQTASSPHASMLCESSPFFHNPFNFIGPHWCEGLFGKHCKMLEHPFS